MRLVGQPGTVRETWFDIEAAASEAGAKVRQQKEKRGHRVLAVPGMLGSATECVESCPAAFHHYFGRSRAS